jgi:hypothetical protein
MIVCNSTSVPMSSSSFVRQRKSTRVSNLEKAKLLHEYAQSNEGNFPTPWHVHPEYPEWKWGSWVSSVLRAYFTDSLDENTKAFMEDSVHWRSRIEQRKQGREGKVSKMPIPDHYEKAKLLHEYAENNEGKFPKFIQVHPEYPEWKWGGWVNTLLTEYVNDSLDENVKMYMEGSVHWRFRIEQLKQKRKSKVGKMPIPDQFEKAKLLHEYAESNEAEFPKPSKVHPDYPEWKWGIWVNNLLQAYFDSKLDESTKFFMEDSIYWRFRIQQLKQIRESKVGSMPSPEHHEKAKLLHKYAENNKGEFPKAHEVHPDYPEWKWGSWIGVLLQAYFNDSLDENVKEYMEGSIYWRFRIEQLEGIRESKVGSIPNPEHHEKAEMLHEYAENNQGEFPTRNQLHPDYPEWKWGSWVQMLLRFYFESSLDENTKAFMEGSVYWRCRIDQINQIRQSKVGTMPIPGNYEKAKLLHEYAKSNNGKFPEQSEVHPEYPEWKWGGWVNNLISRYLSGQINQETIDAMEASPYWRSRITDRIARRRETTWSPPPKPPKPKQARMLHVYAENNGGNFPTADEIHPEFPEWRRSSWVESLINDYLIDALDSETRKILDSSIHWEAKIQERREELKHIQRRLVGEYRGQ